MPVLRVLIVEDEPLTAGILSELVIQEGSAVCGIVSSGHEVASVVDAVRPDIVLMDAMLEDGLTGIDVTRDLVRRLALPVIVISSAENRTITQAIARCGAFAFMKKPVSADALRVNLELASRQCRLLRRLARSEVLHRDFFDNAAVGMYICHPDGYYLAVNHVFARMMGYDGRGQQLAAVRSLDQQVYADPGRWHMLLEKMRQSTETCYFESRVFGRDGDIFWIAEHLAPIHDASGRLERYEGVAVNITGRKDSEHAMRVAYTMLNSTVEAIPRPVVLADLRHNILFHNSAFAERFPVLLRNHRLACVAASDGSLLFERFCDAARQNRDMDDPLRGLVRFAHTEVDMEATISPYRSPEGAVIGGVLLL